MPSIRGVVKDKETGAPLPWVLITADGYSTTSDEAGRYELKLLPLGTYLVKARTMDYRPWTRKIVLTRDIELPIEMERAVLRERDEAFCPHKLDACPFFRRIIQMTGDIAALKRDVQWLKRDARWVKGLLALILAAILGSALLL